MIRDQVVVEVAGLGQFLSGGPPAGRLSCDLRRLLVPPLMPAVRDCLFRIAARRTHSARIGSRVWLPRLAVSVLVHGRVADGWACTLVSADRADEALELPVGVVVLADEELRAAVPASGSAPGTSSVERFCDAWRIRLADRGASSMLVEALLGAADPRQMVDLGDRALLLRSGCRTRAAFGRRCQDLLDLGALHPLPGVAPTRRAQLTLPDPVWTW